MVGDDFSLYYDSYSVDERVDSDSKVCWCGWLSSFPLPSRLYPTVWSAAISCIPPPHPTSTPLSITTSLYCGGSFVSFWLTYLSFWWCLFCFGWFCLTGSHHVAPAGLETQLMSSSSNLPASTSSCWDGRGHPEGCGSLLHIGPGDFFLSLFPPLVFFRDRVSLYLWLS